MCTTPDVGYAANYGGDIWATTVPQSQFDLAMRSFSWYDTIGLVPSSGTVFVTPYGAMGERSFPDFFTGWSRLAGR
jgi:hypothetical protein